LRRKMTWLLAMLYIGLFCITKRGKVNPKKVWLTEGWHLPFCKVTKNVHTFKELEGGFILHKFRQHSNSRKCKLFLPNDRRMVEAAILE